jgi:predicted GIY-YIG superfamily endonuclease
VLLHNSEQAEPFGIYVGKTGLTAEERFANHKSGYKTKRYMTRDAVRLLTPFFDHLRDISDEDAVEIEPALAHALRDAGYWVKGGH